MTAPYGLIGILRELHLRRALRMHPEVSVLLWPKADHLVLLGPLLALAALLAGHGANVDALVGVVVL